MNGSDSANARTTAAGALLCSFLALATGGCGFSADHMGPLAEQHRTFTNVFGSRSDSIRMPITWAGVVLVNRSNRPVVLDSVHTIPATGARTLAILVAGPGRANASVGIDDAWPPPSAPAAPVQSPRGTVVPPHDDRGVAVYVRIERLVHRHVIVRGVDVRYHDRVGDQYSDELLSAQLDMCDLSCH